MNSNPSQEKLKQSVGRPKTKILDPKPAFLTMIVNTGDSIGEACRRAVRLADQKHCPIRFTYQGMDLEAQEGADEWDLANRWFQAQKGRAV